MTKLIGSQLSLIAESEFDERSIGDWDYDELGTDNFLVPNSSLPELGTKNFHTPNSPLPELGTKNFHTPNSPLPELGTKNFHTPNFDRWHPPLGCLQQKWIKDHQYWYWRYYKVNGKKRSLYLGKDYNKAIRKAIKIGIPPDAKLPKPTRPKTDPQNKFGAASNLVDIAQTTHPASRNPIAA